MKNQIMFFVSTGGIYLSYLVMSIISQKIYSQEYKSQTNHVTKDKFKFPLLIVWLGALFCTIFGYGRSIILKQRKNPIPHKQQGILGFLYTLNILCTNMALLYLPYPVQVIGRQSRLLAVVLIGVFFSRIKKSGQSIKLSITKLTTGLIITAGVLLFNFAKDSKKQNSFDEQHVHYGYILLMVSILADALFADTQAYQKSNYSPSANHLFTSANKYTFIFCFLFSIIKGELLNQIYFCIDHPQAMYDLLIICTLQVAGQVSIYYVVANFKQHIFPIIATTRKIFTFLLSVFVYKHTVNNYQWLAIVIVFGGVIYEYFDEKNQKTKKQVENTKKIHTE